jgi:hypothetical protein
MAYHDGRDNFCQVCDRSFINANAYKQHFQSSTHRPRNIKCPFKDLGCKSKDFISITALARHFDANGCTFTRRQFNGIAYDLNQSGDHDQEYSIIVPDVDPRKMGISGHVRYLITKGAGRRFSNGEDDSWTCTYRDCGNECGAKFNTKDGLKAHLKSPKHEVPMYRCPGCETCFTDLGSACSHIGADLRTCNVNVGDVKREVRELITAVTQRQDSRARPLKDYSERMRDFASLLQRLRPTRS